MTLYSLLIAAAAALLALSQPAAAATVYGLGLVGNDAKGQITVLASMDSKTGNITWSKEFHIDPTFYGCNVAFGPASAEWGGRPVYYVPSGSGMDPPPQTFRLLTVDARSGQVLHTANMSVKYDMPMVAYDAADGAFYGAGSVLGKPNSGVDVVSINVTTGHVTVLFKNVDIPTLVTCNSAWGPGSDMAGSGLGSAIRALSKGQGQAQAQAASPTSPAKASPSFGSFYFVSSLNNGTSLDWNDLLSYDVGSNTFSAVWETHVVPSAIAAYTPPGSTTGKPRLLVLGFPCDKADNCGNTSLWDVDPLTPGSNTTLVTLPNEYNPQQGVLTYSADCGGDKQDEGTDRAEADGAQVASVAAPSSSTSSSSSGCAYAVMTYNADDGSQVDKLVTFVLPPPAREQGQEQEEARAATTGTAGSGSSTSVSTQTASTGTAAGPGQATYTAVTVDDSLAFFGLHGLGMAG